MPDFKDTANSQIVHEIVTPLIAIRDGRELVASGTAFVIGRGWGVTAFHVIEDLIARYQGGSLLNGPIEISFEMLAYLTLDKGERIMPLKVMRAWAATPFDVAVLALGSPPDWEDHRWKVPALDLLPPPVGTPVVAFGFPNSRFERTSDDQPSTLHVSPSSSTGDVLEIHHLIRDSARLPFPCFRTNARFDGGMSGAPVFNNRTGHVCGIVCSSIPATREDEEHISYASTLWPMLGVMVDASEEAPSGAIPYPLSTLFDNNVMAGVNRDCVRVAVGANGLATVAAEYDSTKWDVARE